MLRQVVKRLARRCPLTEEIGARRRDLYAADTFKPIDDNFDWSRIRGTSASSLKSAIPDIQSSLSNCTEPSEDSSPSVCSSTIISPVTESDSESLRVSRLLDMWVHRTSQIDQSIDQSTLESWLATIQALGVGNLTQSSDVNILEEYLCLYNKYRVGASLRKLSGSMKYSPALRLLEEYNEVLAIPDPLDLCVVRAQIASIAVSSIPRTLWSPYISVTCFFNHPTVRSISNTAGESPSSPGHVGKSKKITKKALKEIRNTLPEQSCVFLYDLLQSPSVTLTRPIAYRLKLLLDKAQAMGDDTLAVSIEKVVDVSIANKFDIDHLLRANTNFKNSLFS